MITSFTSVKKDCKKITDSISRLLASISKIDGTRAFCGAEIRDMASSVDIASVRDLGQLYRSFVYKTEKHPPIARNTKGKEANKRRRETLRVQKGVVGIFAQALDKNRELALLRLWESASASVKLRMEYYFKHFVCFGARREISLRSQSAWWECDWHRAGLDAQIPDDTRPRDLFRRCLWRTNGAFSPLFPEQSCSYRNDTPAKQKINENACKSKLHRKTP